MSDTPSTSPASLTSEVETFLSVADQIALGDHEIRRRFAFYIIGLFVGANVFVMIGLGVAFWQDCVQMAAKLIKPSDRIIDSKVAMTLLGATTVQLGTVIYTITNAIFPAPKVGR
jgi:hypothetical protein